MSPHLKPSIIAGADVLPEFIFGIAERSQTRRQSIPLTLNLESKTDILSVSAPILAVLNTKLQVKGIDNLRVFDVSMMPNIVAANTNAPAMAIANNATNIMLKD